MNIASNAVGSTSLCPGYKQVDGFGPDEDYEDEEVEYVTLDLGNIEPTLVPSSSTYRLIVGFLLSQW
jgi:general transcription factor 3C polypeptide 6